MSALRRKTRRRTTAAGFLAAAASGAALIFGGPFSSSAATPQAEHGYIVTLKGAAGALPLDSVKKQASTLTEHYGASLGYTYSEALHGFSAHMTSAEAGRLADNPLVANVVRDKKVHASATQPNPPSWGLDRIDQPDLPLNKSYSYPDSAGSGVTAYIIDTGVRISHHDFGGRASYGYDAIDHDSTAQDGNGHGTHVAATVAGSSYGVAKKANVVAVRVLDDSGSGTTSQVVEGIDWVTKHARKPAVANMSLGGLADPTLDAAVRNSIASGVTYSIAAGNSSAPSDAFSPARVQEALTVGATEKNDSMAVYSNYGSGVDLLAPGTDITSAWNTSDTATNTISGTSMATPHVTGAAALYLAGHTTSSPAQVANALTSAAAKNKISNTLLSPNRLLQVTG